MGSTETPDRFMPDYVEFDPAPGGAAREVLKGFGRLRGVRDAVYFRVLDLWPADFGGRNGKQ